MCAGNDTLTVKELVAAILKALEHESDIRTYLIEGFKGRSMLGCE